MNSSGSTENRVPSLPVTEDISSTKLGEEKMSGLSCKTCLQLYNSKLLPRILSCGHTYCSMCLVQALEGSKQCPDCNKVQISKDIDDYPVNRAILEMCDELSETPLSNIRQRIHAVSDKHELVLNFVSNLMSKKNKVAMMDMNKIKLLELISKDDSDMDVKEVTETLDEIEHFMNEMAKIFSCESSVDFYLDYHSSQFDTPKQFLVKLFEEIKSGKKIVAHKVIQGEERYARISISSNTLLIHAFNHSPKDEDAKLVQFEDLKNTITQGELCAFFSFTETEGNWQRIFIECFSQSVLGVFFFKMCTGETGPTYLGAPFKKSNEYYRCADKYECFAKILINLDQQLKLVDKYLVNLAKKKNEMKCHKNKYYVTMGPTGSFEIFKNNKESSNVVGTVINHEEINKFFANREFTKVQDCGLALSLQ